MLDHMGAEQVCIREVIQWTDERNEQNQRPQVKSQLLSPGKYTFSINSATKMLGEKNIDNRPQCEPDQDTWIERPNPYSITVEKITQ
jgi:hypothetical protein